MRTPRASGSIPCTLARRLLRSPITAPTYSSGTRTSSFIIGSSRMGRASSTAFLNAAEPATDPLLDRGDELARDGAADDGVLELEPLSPSLGVELDVGVTVLAVA